jgi:large subunit ribosomal protein L22
MTKAQKVKTEPIKLVSAHARDLHIAPRKMRLVTNLVKNMNALDAMVQLQHTEKKASPMLIKLIQSAVANAKNNFSMDPQHLFIKSITADMGKVMKRYFPRARGSAFEIRRKMSHVNIVLEERKKGKASKIKAGFLNKPKEEVSAKGGSASGGKSVNVDQQAAVHEKPVKEEVKKSQVFKTDEQKKMSKVANKRRLFNRKTGE